MSFAELVCFQAVCPEELHELKAESLDRGPVPVQANWKVGHWNHIPGRCIDLVLFRKEVIFIATRGLLPVILQTVSYAVFPNHKWPVWVAYPVYFLCFASFAMRMVRRGAFATFSLS